MAKFEIFDSDDDFENQFNILTVPCPICGKEFDITLDALNTSVICPHCNADIEIKSE